MSKVKSSDRRFEVFNNAWKVYDDSLDTDQAFCNNGLSEISPDLPEVRIMN
jgi:hypothetical protein